MLNAGLDRPGDLLDTPTRERHLTVIEDAAGGRLDWRLVSEPLVQLARAA